MFCPRCGNNNENNARFCFSCGQRFAQGNQPAGPSGPQWGRFQDPAPPPPPAPTPVAPPPPPRVMHTQIVAAPPPPVRRGNPALAVAVIAGLAIVLGGVFFLTRDDNKSSGGVLGGDDPKVTGPVTQPPAGRTPTASPVPSVNDGPVVSPGYKMTAIFVPPPGSTDQKGLEPRLFDAIVAGVDWNESAKLYGRRYPLQYVFNNATTNLLLKPPNVDQAKKLLAAAGYTNTKPKFLLTFNPSDRVFGVWLTQQINNLGFSVVTDANNFSPDEKAKGYHGLIVAVLP